jgi:RNA polymerase sigma-70 factor (ECF subfamily)
MSGVGRPESNPGSVEAAYSDQDAVRRMAQRDPGGLAELYDRYSRSVYSFALHILGEQAEAEDVVQDVFAQAWTQAARYESSRGAVPAWLLTMTRSRAIDRLRTRRARPDSQAAGEGHLHHLVDPAEPPDVGLFTRDQISRVRSAMSQLPIMQRVVIEMAYLQGLSHREIAEQLEVPLGTVKTRARLALLKLREALTESLT